MNRLPPFARYCLLLAVIATCAWTAIARAVREHAAGTLLTKENIEAAISDSLPAQVGDADRAFLATALAAGGKPALTGDRQSASLAGIARGRVDLDGVPGLATAPLVPLRKAIVKARSAGRSTAPLLSPEAARALELGLAAEGWNVRTPDQLYRSFGTALGWWAAAWLLLGGVLLRRTGRTGLAPVASMAGLTAANLVLQLSCAGPLTGAPVWSAVATHLLLGAVAGVGVTLAARALAGRPLPEAVTDGRGAILAAAGLFMLLAGVNLALGRTGPWIDLPVGSGSVQPMEWVKPLVVIGLASFIGRYRASLGGRAWVAAAVAGPLIFLPLSGALFDDWGVAFILLFALAGLLVAITGRMSLALLVVVATLVGPHALAALRIAPGLTAQKRMEIFEHPWANGLPGGGQLANGFRSMSRGRWTGQGIAHARPESLEEASKDMILPYLAECWGVFGLAVAVAALLVLVRAAMRAAATPHPRPEARLLPVAIGVLLAAQLAVIGLGVVGVVPLTGVVTPFLSRGGTALVTWMILGALVVNHQRADQANARAGDPFLRGLLLAEALAFAAALALVGRATWIGAINGRETLVRPMVVRDGDGNIRAKNDPALVAARNELSGAMISDTRGLPIVDAALREGPRYPFGAALAPLAGVGGGGRTPYPDTLEDAAVDGWAPFRRVPTPIEPVLICAKEPCADKDWRLWDVAPREGAARESILAAAAPHGRMVAAATEVEDLSALVGAAMLTGPARDAELARLGKEIPRLKTTIDASLQADVYELLLQAMRRKGVNAPAAAAVIIDAQTGHVLVQASAPAPDPDAVTSADVTTRAFDGRMGVLTDRARLPLPPGSIFKVLVEIAAREFGHPDFHFNCLGKLWFGTREHGRSISCDEGERHGWIHSREAISHSCNLYEGQRAIAIGAPALREFFSRIPMSRFDVPENNLVALAQTGFGQWHVEMTATQVAVAFSAVANGGDVPLCELLAPEGEEVPCTPLHLAKRRSVLPVQDYMRDAVTGGTAREAKEPDGARWEVRAKTGTAQQNAIGAETGANHAWLGGYYEGDDGRRYAFAFLVVRGGYGGSSAAWLAPRVGELLSQHGYLP
ncbi:MAG: FtsW/RodA/SpoVE family cell cycle protein [Myxococcota bacterium]